METFVEWTTSLLGGSESVRVNLGLEGFGGDELKQRNSGSHWLQGRPQPSGLAIEGVGQCQQLREKSIRKRERGRKEDDNAEAKCGRFLAHAQRNW